MSSIPPPPPPPPGGQPPSIPPYGGPPTGYTSPSENAFGQYATFGTRFAAYIVDALVLVLFELPGIIVATAAKSGFGFVLWVAGAIAFLFLYSKKVSEGGSWGQKALGIRIIDAITGQNISPGRAFGRRIASLISGWICYLGFLWMLWDADKQTWHDKIVGTKVIKV
ncbi:MAG: RDD family protein [Actinomycetota bacterium]